MEKVESKELDVKVKHWKQLNESEYLGSFDLPEDGKPIKLKIKDVHLENVMNPETFKKEWKSCISFEGAKKRMILNKKSNPEAIASWHGTDPRGWFGKEISVFRTKVKNKGELVDAIRVVPNDKKKVQDNSAAAASAVQ